MFRKNLVSIAVAAVVGLGSAQALAGPAIHNGAIELVGAGAVSDPLIAVEANRAAIVNRLVADHGHALAANGIAVEAFRAALTSLRADQLLAASLVSTVQEITAIVSQDPPNGAALQRFVALTPTVPTSMASLPLAEAYLVRENDVLSVVKASQLQLGSATAVLVGYFAPATSGVVTSTIVERFAPKDGSGSGPNSWIGYTAGNNVASGSGSAVAAGQFNTASGQNSFVAAGQSNLANGLSSTVIAGFDNQALVVGGAGNRASGARSVVVGGGYNVASGQWSFIGGGGRQSGGGAPGSNAQDNLASGDFSVVTGGQGNRATANSATVGGGYFNFATGAYGTVPGGYANNASGARSIAMGSYGNAEMRDTVSVGCGAFAHNPGAMVLSATYGNVGCGNDYYFTSAAENEIAMRAGGGLRFVTQIDTSTGNPTMQVNITPAGELTFPQSGRQQIRIRTDNTPYQGIGGQLNTLYLRTSQAFGFYFGGAHSDAQQDPGSGGTMLALLQPNASGFTPTVTGNFRVQTVTQTSDRNQKTDFEPLQPRGILAKLAELPVSMWSYKNETGTGVRHIGPVAQDFMRLFNVGYDDKSITAVDAQGVAFAAIQGLKQELDEKNSKIERLERELAAIKKKLGLD